MLSAISLTTARTSTVAIAPIGCSVKVETASPMAPSAAMAAATYRVTKSTRSSPSPSGTVFPDSSVTGPIGNSAAPVAREAATTTQQADSPNTTIDTYLAASSRARPAGTVSRYRSVPSPASPAIESPDHGDRQGQHQRDHEGDRDERQEHPVAGELADEGRSRIAAATTAAR